MDSWNAALLDQITFLWDYVFVPRLADLTDEEYRWERFPDAGP